MGAAGVSFEEAAGAGRSSQHHLHYGGSSSLSHSPSYVATLCSIAKYIEYLQETLMY